MKEIRIKAHEYVSASRKIDNAFENHRNPASSDAAFQNMIITMVDEACAARELYSPAKNGEALKFVMNNTRVYALYTDREMAKACAGLCTGANEVCKCDLGGIIDQQPIALGFNMGLPGMVILPPDIVHTIMHLKYVHQLGWKHAPDSQWNEWITIMERYFAALNEPDCADISTDSEEVTMYLPVREIPGTDAYMLG